MDRRSKQMSSESACNVRGGLKSQGVWPQQQNTPEDVGRVTCSVNYLSWTHRSATWNTVLTSKNKAENTCKCLNKNELSTLNNLNPQREKSRGYLCHYVYLTVAWNWLLQLTHNQFELCFAHAYLKIPCWWIISRFHVSPVHIISCGL